MSIKEDIENAKKEIAEIKEESFAMELIKGCKQTNKRLFTIIIVILGMWFATIGAFLYYINTIDYEEITEIADTDDGGNACVGDNCNNGEINYGKGN